MRSDNGAIAELSSEGLLVQTIIFFDAELGIFPGLPACPRRVNQLFACYGSKAPIAGGVGRKAPVKSVVGICKAEPVPINGLPALGLKS